MISVIFENNDILVLNKPAGIAVHGDGKHENEKTVADFILEKYPELEKVGEPFVIEHKGEQISIPKPGIVHRLDKDTSGVLVVAKNQESFLFLKTQFMERETKKIYHAVVHGWPKENSGVITEPIGRSRGDVRKWTAGNGARGEMRDARTEYEVLRHYSETNRAYTGVGSTEGDTCAYVELHPTTGRTHQLRVHLKYINHPIICDELYAPGKTHHLGFERLALHARSLTIKMPLTPALSKDMEREQAEQTFVADFPEDFENARKIVGLK